MAAEEPPSVPFTSTAKATSLVDAISARDWVAALHLTDLARDSLAEAAQLDPFELALEVDCLVDIQMLLNLLFTLYFVSNYTPILGQTPHFPPEIYY
jgi:hypothetical protein